MGNTCIPVEIHFDIWQNQYNIVKLKNKIKIKKIKLNKIKRKNKKVLCLLKQCLPNFSQIMPQL